MFSRGEECLKNMPQLDEENRQLLIAPFETSEHFRISSRFQEPPEQKITRADWQAVGPPYRLSRYAEIDLVIANRRAQNIVKDEESVTKTAFPSDHFPVNIRVKIILAEHKRGARNPHHRGNNPYQLALKNFSVSMRN